MKLAKEIAIFTAIPVLYVLLGLFLAEAMHARLPSALETAHSVLPSPPRTRTPEHLDGAHAGRVVDERTLHQGDRAGRSSRVRLPGWTPAGQSPAQAAGTGVSPAGPDMSQAILLPTLESAYNGEEKLRRSGEVPNERKAYEQARPYLRPCAQRGPGSQRHQRDLGRHPIMVLAPWHGDRVAERECDVPCVFTSNKWLTKTADAFLEKLFEGSAIPTDPAEICERAHGTQKRVLHTMESFGNYAFLKEPGRYDLYITHELDSDVPVPYFSARLYDFMRPPQEKTATAMMAAFISNCGDSERLQLLQDLARHGVTIHSYGLCLNNATEKIESGSGWDSKLALSSRYMFTAAFESTRSPFYVTEKLFQPLVSGSVPVHFGDARHLHMFVPSPQSVLSAHDFPGARELAQEIIRLAASPAEYAQCLEWKKRPLPDHLRILDHLSTLPHECRLCIRLADLHRREGLQEAVDTAAGRAHEHLTADSVRVRERGKFWFKTVSLVCPSGVRCELPAIVEAVRRVFGVPGGKRVFLFDVWSREEVRAASALAAGQELEFVPL